MRLQLCFKEMKPQLLIDTISSTKKGLYYYFKAIALNENAI